MNLIGIIPSRYNSTRFPGKALCLLGDMPVLVHVYLSALKFGQWNDLLVATDDLRISSICNQYKIPYIMTSGEHSDCLDRAAEVSHQIDADRYVVIQGDEPFFDCRTLNVDFSLSSFAGFYTEIIHKEEIYDPNVVKVIISKVSTALYFSRSPVFFADNRAMKQVGVYVFDKNSLCLFSQLGVSPLEKYEKGGNLTRFLDNGIPVPMYFTSHDSLSIDTTQDLIDAQKLLAKSNG